MTTRKRMHRQLVHPSPNLAIRMPRDLLSRVRAVAERKALPYQTWIRSEIAQAVERAERAGQRIVR